LKDAKSYNIQTLKINLMLITLKYPGYQEYIPIKSILKFTKNDDQQMYEIVASEVFSPRDFTIKNIVLLINEQTQPLAYQQIEEYLNSKL
jgi:hypothetical protein